jgi:beta-lactamase regulating signal transducer with metallopeptidase domain
MSWLSSILSNVVLASLVALAAWMVQRRLGSPALARVLWLLALVKLVTPPLVSVPLVELPSSVLCTVGLCGCTAHALWPPIVRTALPWLLLAAWSAGAGVTFAVAWRRWSRFRQLLAHADAAPQEWQSLATRLARELSLRRAPEILAAPGALPPLVVAGWRRSRLLVPTGLMDRLNASQREALLLHELVHLKRGDHLVRVLELAVGVAFWWLPIVGSIGRQLRTCEESCCDEAVVSRLPKARRDYARLLLDVVDFADPLPRQSLPQATAMSAAENLEQRLRFILDARRRSRRRSPAAVLVMGAACVVVPCSVHCEVSQQRLPPRAAASENCDSAIEPARWAGCDPPLEIYGCPTFPR